MRDKGFGGLMHFVNQQSNKFDVNFPKAFIAKLLKHLCFKRNIQTDLNKKKNTEKKKEIRKKISLDLSNSLKEGKKLIFLDETEFVLPAGINPLSPKNNQNTYNLVEGELSKIMLVVAITEEEILGFMLFDKTYTARDFIFFIMKLYEEMNFKGLNINDYVIVYDRLSIHTSKFTQKFLEPFNTALLPPYSPQLSPVTKFIEFLRAKIIAIYCSSHLSLIESIMKSFNFCCSNMLRKLFRLSLKFYPLAFDEINFP
jgi:hypothetical protein